MEIAMMEGTEGDHKFVADFLAEAPALCKAKVMGVRRLAVADQTGEFCHPPEMGFVSDTSLKS
jgi:hypothetical protein